MYLGSIQLTLYPNKYPNMFCMIRTFVGNTFKENVWPEPVSELNYLIVHMKHPLTFRGVYMIGYAVKDKTE